MTYSKCIKIRNNTYNYRHRERDEGEKERGREGKKGKKRKGVKRREKRRGTGTCKYTFTYIYIYTHTYVLWCAGVTLRNRLTKSLMYVPTCYFFENDHSISHTWTVLHASLFDYILISVFATARKKERIGHIAH